MDDILYLGEVRGMPSRKTEDSPKCAVEGCEAMHSSERGRGEPYQLFRYPLENEGGSWARRFRLVPGVSVKDALICSKHFGPGFYRNESEELTPSTVSTLKPTKGLTRKRVNEEEGNEAGPRQKRKIGGSDEDIFPVPADDHDTAKTELEGGQSVRCERKSGYDSDGYSEVETDESDESDSIETHKSGEYEEADEYADLNKNDESDECAETTEPDSDENDESVLSG